MTYPTAKPPSCHDTIVCIVTRLANLTARLSRYKDCIVTQPPTVRPSLLSRYKTSYRDTHPQRPGPRSCHDTKLRIATLTPSGQALVRAPLALGAGRSYRSAVSCACWLYRGVPLRAPALPNLAVSRYNQLYRDPAPNMGSSPSSCLQIFFFHIIFFSHLFHLLEDPKKLFIYFFSFSSRTK